MKNTPGGGQLNFANITNAQVLGVAATQSVNINYALSREAGIVTVDRSTGRVLGGVAANTGELDIDGAPGQTYDGLGAAYDEDSLVLIKISGGTYLLPDLDLTFGHSGIEFSGPDTHALFTETEHLEPLVLSGGATATLSRGSNLFCHSLSLDGTLDIGTNQVSDWFDSAQQIRNWIVSGLAGGNGITSSAIDADHTIGYSNNVIKWTWYGDANLDGTVDFNDLLAVAQNYGASNADWSQGDFNYDGKVDFADLLKVGQNFGKALPAQPAVRLPA